MGFFSRFIGGALHLQLVGGVDTLPPTQTYQFLHPNLPNPTSSAAFLTALDLDNGGRFPQAPSTMGGLVGWDPLTEIFGCFEAPRVVETTSAIAQSCRPWIFFATKIWIFFTLAASYRGKQGLTRFSPTFHNGKWCTMVGPSPWTYKFSWVKASIVGGGASKFWGSIAYYGYPPGNDHISHLGKRKIIFKSAFLRGYVSSQEVTLPEVLTF